MNIAFIETFLAVVETGNLNRASERLHVTESTVTARLDGLETQLGQQLLVRSRRGAQMTKAGYKFLVKAERILHAWKQAQTELSLPKGFQGLFSFGCGLDLWTGLGKTWILEAMRVAPELAFETWAGDDGQLRRWLQSGLVDAVLMIEPVGGTGIKSRAFAEDRIVQVSTTPRRAVEWAPDYIYVEYGPDVRRQHDATWTADRTAYMTISGGEWALDFLLARGGSAYLPWRMVESLVGDSILHCVEGAPEFIRRTHLSYRDGSTVEFPVLADMLAA